MHSARTFLYDGESECDANAQLILESIEDAAQVGGRQFVAMKMTAIAKVSCSRASRSSGGAALRNWARPNGNRKKEVVVAAVALRGHNRLVTLDIDFSPAFRLGLFFYLLLVL